MTRLLDSVRNFLIWLGGGPVEHEDDDDSVSAQAVVEGRIAHALVLPDRDFLNWYRAAEPYTQAFERVAVVRSPAGNDLNRFRNVTAVETPGVWLRDNALDHIRRIYPMVVQVDVIKASTPDQLAAALRTRITNNDRYGQRTAPVNIRFTLGWPADALPARIITPFNAAVPGGRNEGIDLYAPPGTTIRAAVGGVVATVMTQPTALGYGQYVQISAENGKYLVTHTQLRNIRVRSGQQVNPGEIIAESASDPIRLVVQQPGAGSTGYKLPSIIDPTPLLYLDHLRLQPTGAGLRVRQRPGTEFPIIDQVGTADLLETLEPHGRTLSKIGHTEWINVRTPRGRDGYAAAWFLNAVLPGVMSNIRMAGVNIDLMHPLGRPTPPRLGRAGWVRLPYNVSFNPSNGTHGNTDINQAYARYRPFIESYARAGYKVIVVFTHQTFGEGAGYVWPRMTSGEWRQLTERFAQMVRGIASQYAGSGLIEAYQIWNEQDAPQGASASVSMPPGNYAYLLSESIRAIRSVDSRTRIITGGHTGGPGNGSNYARQTISAMPPGILPDGVACHPYGRGTVMNTPYTIFGHIDEELRAYGAVLPGRPLWITEFGVLDRPNDPPTAISDYATGFMNHLKLNYAGQVAAAVWYAWAQSMDNGYGLVGTNDQPRQPLYDRFLNS